MPEPSLAHVHPGDTVALTCDNCPPDLTGVVSFVSPQAEYTPPFIYSESTRAKFVFLAEARPKPDQATLFNPGQPVTVKPQAAVAMNDLVIDVRDLRKSFGDLKVVEGLSLQVARGEICGFLGANGSGKTTTIRMLCGLLAPDGGSGTCIGYDILRQAHDIRRQVGYMTQRFSLYDDLTVFENLDFVAAVFEMPNRRAAVAEMIERMGLGDRRDQLAGQLSGGWKQRLALAACVLHEPKLLLLDEPTAGVDVKARREFWDLIHDMAVDGLTTLVSTHYMDEAERCSRIVYLAQGRIVVQGGAAAVIGGSGLVTFEATGEGVDAAARRLRGAPGVEAAGVFGRALHVAGMDRAALAGGDAVGGRRPRMARGRAAARGRVHPHAEPRGGAAMNRFSFPRLIALLRKETIQVMRDAMTLRMIIAIPIMQLFLFGYAINSDPKHLPAGLLSIDDSKYERTIAAALNNSGYYNLQQLRSEQEADEGLARGDLMFVVEIPPGFDRAVDRGENPSVLIDADATDPTAIGNAVAALIRCSPTSIATCRRSARRRRRRRRSISSSTPATIPSSSRCSTSCRG